VIRLVVGSETLPSCPELEWTPRLRGGVDHVLLFLKRHDDDGHVNPLIVFHQDGTGAGVFWDVTAEGAALLAAL